MSESLAFWICMEDGKAKVPDVDLHVNQWLFSSNLCFLDVGIQLTSLEGAYSVHAYFPFKLEEADFFSLHKNVKKEGVLAAIFNEDCSVTDDFHLNEGYGVQKKSSGEKFVFREFNSTEIVLQEITALSSGVGTEMSMQFSDLKDDFAADESYKKQYVRFRIVLRSDAISKFVTGYQQSDWWVVSSSTDVDVVDFRINEVRNLPREIGKKLSKNGIFNSSVKRILYFLIVDTRVDFEVTSNGFSRCRVLEKKGWREYLSSSGHDKVIDKFIDKKPMIFQWKNSYSGNNVFGDYNALVKTKKVNSSVLRTIYFAVFVVILGALGSWLATVLQPYTIEIIDCMSALARNVWTE